MSAEDDLVFDEAQHLHDDRESRIIELGLVDRPALARRLRAGGKLKLLKHEREFLADLVEEKNRPTHRPPTLEAALKRDRIANLYIFLNTFLAHGEGKFVNAATNEQERIKKIVAEDFSVSETYVDKVLRALEPERRRQIEKSVARILDTGHLVNATGLGSIKQKPK